MGIDEVMITDYSSKYKEFKRHGKRIAYQLNLNYFDFDEISCEHAVRHMISIENFADTRIFNTSISETGKRMTDAANNEYGEGNFNNRMRLLHNEDSESDIIYNDQDMEAELANKAFEKIAKRDSLGKEQFKVRNS